MERLDKVLGNSTLYSRKEVKSLIRNRRVKVNNEIVKLSDFKVNSTDIIMIDNNIINTSKYIYLVLNKPKGYVSSSNDKINKTVLDLIGDEYKCKDLFPAGRLDKDTTGLMIITNDGMFAHNILSPNKHVLKTYYVKIDNVITSEMIMEFKNGVKLKDNVCKSAILEKISDNECYVTLREGRYHQIKRMFGCFSSKVVELKRIKIGKFSLPNDLEIGAYRELTNDELCLIERNL